MPQPRERGTRLPSRRAAERSPDARGHESWPIISDFSGRREPAAPKLFRGDNAHHSTLRVENCHGRDGLLVRRKYNSFPGSIHRTWLLRENERLRPICGCRKRDTHRCRSRSMSRNGGTVPNGPTVVPHGTRRQAIHGFHVLPLRPVAPWLLVVDAVQLAPGATTVPFLIPPSSCSRGRPRRV